MGRKPAVGRSFSAEQITPRWVKQFKAKNKWSTGILLQKKKVSTKLNVHFFKWN